MGFLDKLLGTSGAAKQSSTPKITVSIDGNSELPKYLPLDKQTEENFDLLMTEFKNLKSVSFEPDKTSILKQVNSHADESTCPYCGVKHEFKASRARKCPDCGEKMVVRSGHYIKETEAEKFDELIREHYDKASSYEQVKSLLKYLQDTKVQMNQGDNFYGLTYFLISLGKSFSEASPIINWRDPKGFSFSDKAWGCFNRARMTDVQEYGFHSTSRKTPEISFEMAEELTRRASMRKTKQSRRSNKLTAINMYLQSVVEAAQLNIELYQLPEIARKVKTIMKEENQNDSLIETEVTEKAKKLKLNPEQEKRLATMKQEILAYSIL